MKIKLLLLLLLCSPLLFSAVVSAVVSNGNVTKRVSVADEEAETPFLLLATVHNYGYIEPCG